MAALEAEGPASAAVRRELVRYQDLRSETLLADQLAHQPESGLRVASALHQHVEDLAFVVHRPPEPHGLARHSPARVLFDARAEQQCRCVETFGDLEMLGKHGPAIDLS